MLDLVIISALAVSGLLFCLKKWGILDTYGVYHRKKWMPEHDCYFCLSAWLTFAPTLVYLELTIGKRFSFSPIPTLSDLWVLFLGSVCTLAIATLSAFILNIIIQPKEV